MRSKTPQASVRRIVINFSVMNMTGCGTAIVTPFRPDGSVDEEALRSLVHWQIDAGIDFLVACGSTGEAATLDENEWLRTIAIVAEAAAGRVPVFAGCTHNSTRVLVRQAALLKQIRGVDAVLSANPYYNKPTQEGQFQHFLALARAVDPLPVVLYNVPGRTAANLEPATVARLAEAAPNIQAIKESSGKLPQIAELVHTLPHGFKIFSGDDNLALAAIGVGADGLISVVANEIPFETAQMIHAALANRWDEARLIERHAKKEKTTVSRYVRTAVLFDMINFLMDATVGFININQNKIIKIFSVASVALLPPTLIASIYGMNFQFMPELAQSWGYPYALVIMTASALVPMWYFRKRGWLK